jgi:hypothetical protein
VGLKNLTLDVANKADLKMLPKNAATFGEII